jgi:hypothetical protein
VDLLLPEGTRLLHIGPAKTGTTSLQSAFHHNRDAIAEYGVHYAGSSRQARSAAAAVATGRPIWGTSPRSMRKWPELVDEVNASTAKRVVISSETFARCGDDAAKEVVDAFGAGRTHVVITMRPLADMLSSTWQQYVQTGSTLTYEKWLKGVLVKDREGKKVTPTFWSRTRIDKLAKRWGDLVGFDNVSVVSLANRPLDFVQRTFEQFVGLPDGILEPEPGESNLSLPFPVAEVVRRFNEMYFDLPGSDNHVQARLLEFGALRYLKEREENPLTKYPIEVPQWAADQAGEIAAEMNEGVRSLGVNVVGDLDALTRLSKAAPQRVRTPSAISTSDAAELMFAMMLASKEEAERDALSRQSPMPTKKMLQVIARRATRRLTRRT